MTWTPQTARRTLAATLGFAALALLPLACENEPVVLEGCECVPVEFGPGTPSRPSCGEALCPAITGSGGIPGEPLTLADEAALDCALEALVLRTPGWFEWNTQQADGQYTEEGYVLIRADGSGVVRTWGQEDLSFVVDAATLGELRPAQEYEGCAAQADLQARFDCARSQPVTTVHSCSDSWLDESA